MRLTILIAATLAFTPLVSVANLVVDFEVGQGSASSYTFLSIGGSNIDLVVTATQEEFVPGQGVIEYPALVDTDGATQNEPGLGVIADSSGFGDDDLIEPPDGTGSRETLFLSFFKNGQPVEVLLNSITFNEVDGNDNFDLLLDDVLTLGSDIDIPGNGVFQPVSELTASVIAIRADGDGGDPNDNFKIAAIDVAAIPEASSFLTFGLVAGGFAMAKRRRGAAQA